MDKAISCKYKLFCIVLDYRFIDLPNWKQLGEQYYQLHYTWPALVWNQCKVGEFGGVSQHVRRQRLPQEGDIFSMHHEKKSRIHA